MYYTAIYKNHLGKEIYVKGKFRTKKAAIQFVESCDDYKNGLVIMQYDSNDYNTRTYIIQS